MDDTGIEIDPAGTCVGTSIELNPLFDPLRPYHITSLSPCRDAGATACGDYDIDFEARVNEIVDMGGDEYWP